MTDITVTESDYLEEPISQPISHSLSNYLPEEMDRKPPLKLKVLPSKAVNSILPKQPKTLDLSNNYAPVYIYHRVKRPRASVEVCACCNFCTQKLSYKGCKRYKELTSELATDNYNDEMIKLNKGVAESYESLA